jgi:microsomal epoxide hydrolase
MADQKDVYFQTSDDVKLHYIDAGEGETIVFIPGWTMPARIWEKQVAYFSHFAHVVAFDPRSQGESDVAGSGHNPQRRGQDIKELIDHLNVEQVTLVGWSLGVLEALSYIQQYGESQLAAAVFVDNSVGEDPPAGGSNPMPEIRKNRQHGTELFVRSMYKSKQSERYLAGITADSLKTPL